MRLVTVNHARWWVPASYSTTLAVQIESERDYHPAIREKLLRLVERAGTLPEVLRLVTWIMEPQGLAVEHTHDPEHLVTQVLATSSVGEMVRGGAPWMSEAAPEDEAVAAVEAQGELTLEDFLA